MTNYCIGPDQMTSDRIEPHRTMSGISVGSRTNKLLSMLLAHEKLGRHKSNITTSVAYRSPNSQHKPCTHCHTIRTAPTSAA